MHVNVKASGISRRLMLVPAITLAAAGTDRAQPAVAQTAKQDPLVKAAIEAYVQDSHGKVLDGGKKYTIAFPKGKFPPAGAFWSVTNYQDHFLVPNGAKKYSVSNWMNPKAASGGSVTTYMQPTSPGADLEVDWLPTSDTDTDSAHASLLAVAGGSGWHMVPAACRGSAVGT